jgi:uncharacterized protein YegP (UPF0339 family)
MEGVSPPMDLAATPAPAPVPKMRITIDRASGGYRVHVWMAGSDELLFWSDIYASKQGAQRAAYHLKAHVGAAAIEDRASAEVSA